MKSNIQQIIKETDDVELLQHIGTKLPHLKDIIYKKIESLGKRRRKMKSESKEYKTQIRPSMNIEVVEVLESFKDESIKEKSTLGDVIYLLLCESPRFKERLDKYRNYWSNQESV